MTARDSSRVGGGGEIDPSGTTGLEEKEEEGRGVPLAATAAQAILDREEEERKADIFSISSIGSILEGRPLDIYD
ncbi:hypothetical protein BDZ91DRAFT_804625 [Kalaharituber pfeilii]|nr:hypothetical protein BDZ91DRAFT_804625 [Kalaharituber pfeilii]